MGCFTQFADCVQETRPVGRRCRPVLSRLQYGYYRAGAKRRRRIAFNTFVRRFIANFCRCLSALFGISLGLRTVPSPQYSDSLFDLRMAEIFRYFPQDTEARHTFLDCGYLQPDSLRIVWLQSSWFQPPRHTFKQSFIVVGLIARWSLLTKYRESFTRKGHDFDR